MDVDNSFETEADGTVTLKPGTGGNFKGTLKPGAARPGLLTNFHGRLAGTPWCHVDLSFRHAASESERALSSKPGAAGPWLLACAVHQA